MKRIGYIFKFSALEKKGILVYGFNQAPYWQSPKPILFSTEDCLSELESGQLVYFDLHDNNIAHNIESASLSNFKRDIVEDIVSCYDLSQDKRAYECEKTTTIRYEDISKIYIRKKNEDDKKVEYSEKDFDKDKIGNSLNKDSDHNNDNEKEEDLSQSPIEENEETPTLVEAKEFKEEGILDMTVDENGNIVDIMFDNDDEYENNDDDLLFDYEYEKYSYGKIRIPESIEDIYNIFAKYNHGQEHSYGQQSDYIDVDILDLNLWINPKIAKVHNCYGKTVQEIKDIYNLFIDRRYKYYSNIASRYKYPEKVEKQKFPISFRFLINKMDEECLISLSKNLIDVQHLLPESFCLNNINLLSNYGLFPSKKVGDLFLENKAESLETIHDYNYWENYLNQCHLFRFKHKKGEGISLHEISKTRIKEIITILNNRCLNHVKNELIIKISHLSHEAVNTENVIRELDLKRIKKIGLFIEDIYNVSKAEWYNVKNEYLVLNIEDKLMFKPILQDFIIEYTRRKIKFGEVDVICHLLKDLNEWIEDDTNNKIRKICIKELENIKEFEQLEEARINNLIDDTLYLEQFKNITKDYSEDNYINLIDKQSYLLPKIALIQIGHILLFQYGGGTISSYNSYIKSIRDKFTYGIIPEGFGKVQDIIEIEWRYREELKKKDLGLEPEVNIASNLNKADRIKLFRQNNYLDNILSKTEIRDYLSDIFSSAYISKESYYPIIGKQCVQDEIVSDLCKDEITIPYEIIIEYLNNTSLEYVKQNGNEFIKFYLWVKSPDETFNWLNIEKHFTKLSPNKQCSLFRYLFYLNEIKKVEFNIEDLYRRISKNGEVCDIIYNIYAILKRKLNNYKATISIKEIKDCSIGDFLFYCKGTILKSLIDGNCYDYPLIGEVKIITKNSQEFFEIDFYSHEITELFNITEESLNKRIGIFERNFEYEKISERKYLVPLKSKFKLKQFALKYLLDDSCNLFTKRIHGLEIVTHNSKIGSLNNKYCQGYYKGTDRKYKLPFMWCKKSPCLFNYHFLTGLSNWEEYKLPDLLYILGKNNRNILNNIWKITAEIAFFFNNRTMKKWVESPNIICKEGKFVAPQLKLIKGINESCSINKEEEVTKWNKSLSTIVDEHSDEWYKDYDEHIKEYGNY